MAQVKVEVAIISCRPCGEAAAPVDGVGAPGLCTTVAAGLDKIYDESRRCGCVAVLGARRCGCIAVLEASPILRGGDSDDEVESPTPSFTSGAEP